MRIRHSIKFESNSNTACHAFRLVVDYDFSAISLLISLWFDNHSWIHIWFIHTCALFNNLIQTKITPYLPLRARSKAIFFMEVLMGFVATSLQSCDVQFWNNQSRLKSLLNVLRLLPLFKWYKWCKCVRYFAHNIVHWWGILLAARRHRNWVLQIESVRKEKHWMINYKGVVAGDALMSWLWSMLNMSITA